MSSQNSLFEQIYYTLWSHSTKKERKKERVTMKEDKKRETYLCVWEKEWEIQSQF